MIKALLPAIMKLFAYLLVLHLGIDSLLMLLSVRIRSENLLQIDSLHMNNDTTPAQSIAISYQQSGKIIRRALCWILSI